MKINKKLIVSSLASAMGLSIVGAITGTVAWYQYSTRSTVAMIGVSAKTAANLQIKVGDGEYKADLFVEDINAYLTTQSLNANLSPITSGAQAKDAALTGLKAHPVYKVFDEQYWGAADTEAYLVLPLTLKWTGVTEGVDEDPTGKKIWVNDALFQVDAANPSGKGDMSTALRAHLAATNDDSNFTYMLLSKNGGNMNVFGALDLNRDGVDDSSAVTWKDFQTGSATVYGTQDAVQASYAKADVAPTIGNDGTPSGGVQLGTTDANGELKVTVTIWLEGWQQLDGDSDWDEAKYIGAHFDLGLEFVTERL